MSEKSISFVLKRIQQILLYPFENTSVFFPNETFIFKKLVMKSSKEQKMLGVAIDNKLNYKSYISELGKKTCKDSFKII